MGKLNVNLPARSAAICLSADENKPLAEQVAIVTGGGSGIGRAFALRRSLRRVQSGYRLASREVLLAAANEINATLGGRTGFSV